MYLVGVILCLLNALISDEAQIIAEYEEKGTLPTVIYWLALATKVILILTCYLLVDAFRRIGRLKLKDLIITNLTISLHFVGFFAFLLAAFSLYAIPRKDQALVLIVGGVDYTLSFVNYLILLVILNGMVVWQARYLTIQHEAITVDFELGLEESSSAINDYDVDAGRSSPNQVSTSNFDTTDFLICGTLLTQKQ